MPYFHGSYYDLEEDDGAERYCEHDDVEIDVISGRAYCQCCPQSWHLSEQEVDEELDRQARYLEECEREDRRRKRREFWLKLTLPIRWPIFRVMEKIWPKKAAAVLTDDEIPF